MSGTLPRTLALAVLVFSATTGTAFAGEVDELTGLEQANIRTMEVATACWFLAIGCSIGSFLNVVAYRLPAGMRLGKPKSHCPHCKTPLGRRENLPVVGWLLLRGRCRHCGIRISPRYPLVEAMVGALFVLLLFVELLSGGAILPVRVPNTFAGVVWIVWYTKWDLVGLYMFHCCLLSVMIVIALIAIDRARVPWSLVLWGLGIGILFPTVWPTLHPVPFVVPRPDWLAAYDWRVEWTDQVFSAGWKQNIGVGLAGLLDSIVGLVGGLVCGFVVAIVEREPRSRHNVRVAFALVGTFLGWQAAVSVATAAILVNVFRLLLERLGCRANVPTPVLLGVLTLGQILAWRWLSTIDNWPSHRGLAGPASLTWLAWPSDLHGQLAVLLLLLAATNLVLRRLGSPHDGSPRGMHADADVERMATEVVERAPETSSE